MQRARIASTRPYALLSMLVLSLLAPLTLHAQAPSWSVDANAYESTMTLTSAVFLNGARTGAQGDLIAAFSGDEVRGVASATPLGGSYVFLLTILADNTGEAITFQYYDAVADQVVTLTETLAFEINANLGTASNPHALSGNRADAGVCISGTPSWSFNPADYESTMTITAAAYLDQVRTQHESDQIAAFVGEEVRGVATPTIVDSEWTFYLTVHGNNDGETLSFQYYDAANAVIYPIVETLSFEANAQHGITSTPMAIHASCTEPSSQTNAAPQATDDTVTMNEDNTLDINVLANDVDPEGDALVLRLQSTPGFGMVRVNHQNTPNNPSDDTILYTPSANYHGTDSFIYQIGDGKGGSDQATVTITIHPVNDAPVAQPDVATTEENVAIDIEVLSNDSDIEGDVLSITAVSPPAHGSAGILSGGQAIRYTPTTGFDGQDTFSYLITDGAKTSEATVTITVTAKQDATTNSAPVFLSAPPTNALSGAYYSYTIVVQDVDEDALMLSASVLPQWLTFTDHHNNEATLSGTPASSDLGTHAVKLLVHDGILEVEQSFVITVSNSNSPPTEASLVLPANNAEMHIGGATGSAPLDPMSVFTVEWNAAVDPDGSPVNYTWELSSTNAFDPNGDILMRVNAGTQTRLGISYGALVHVLDNLGAGLGGWETLYHRVLTSDGILISMSPVFSFKLIRGTLVDSEDDTALPEQFTLQGNYPNPFNPATRIAFEMPTSQRVEVAIYDVMGRHVETLVNGVLQAGRHEVTWEAESRPSGTYFYRVTAGSLTKMRQMLLLK